MGISFHRIYVGIYSLKMLIVQYKKDEDTAVLA